MRKAAREFIVFAVLLLWAFPPLLWAASVDGALTEEQAARDSRILQRALKELHPALTKYRTQAQIDAAFARFDARGGAAREAREMYLAATELAAYIQCGHTWTNTLNQQGPIKAALLDAPNKLPVRMTMVEGRWLVLASVDPALSAGDEIVSIDGHGTRDVVARMMPLLRADGSSDGKRLRQLGHDRNDYSQMDILWPLLSPPVDAHYALEVRRGDGAARKLDVAAVSLSARESALALKGFVLPSEEWRFRIEKDVGYLTLPTFSFHDSTFDWKGFIENSFARLNAEKIRFLVIDIRDNEGGDGAIGGEILSHLIDKPVDFVSDQSTSTYERVPYVLARYLDTWDFSFFDRTGQVEKILEGTAVGKYRYLPNFRKAQTVTPAATPFKGRTFVLVGGENSSAGFQFAKLIQQSGAATLVGQPTGGNLRGLNGGQLAWVNLPNSGVAVDIPLLAATFSVDTPDASVTPEILVTPSFDARRAGRDVEMEAVLDRITARND